MPSIHRDAEQRDEADRADTLTNARDQKPKHAAEDRHRNHAHGEQVSTIEPNEPQQYRDQRG